MTEGTIISNTSELVFKRAHQPQAERAREMAAEVHREMTQVHLPSPVVGKLCEENAEAVVGRDPDTNPASNYREFFFQPIKMLNGKSRSHSLLLFISFLGMFVGFISGALLLRFYFARGGSRRWLSTWIQTAGWPIFAIAMGIVYWKQGLRLTPFTPRLAGAYILLGCLTAMDNFMYAWGMSYLPVSTNGLLSSSQLAFTAIFALLITRQRISAYSWNAIVLVSSSAVILALHSDSDKPAGVTRSQYVLGYIMTISSAALYGLLYPLTELIFRKVLGGRSNHVVLEMQAFVSIIATMVATIGMAANHDFAAIHKESRNFRSGQTTYYMVLFCSTISWQFAFLGAIGIIFFSSSLLAGVILATILPFASIFAVIIFHDSFGGLKIVSLLLSLWGFASYIYGGYLDMLSEATHKEVPAAAAAVENAV